VKLADAVSGKGPVMSVTWLTHRASVTEPQGAGSARPHRARLGAGERFLQVWAAYFQPGGTLEHCERAFPQPQTEVLTALLSCFKENCVAVE
jgi:hypothetical protein